MLDITSITLNAHFITYLIPCFSCIFWCISHHPQRELTCSLLKNTCFCAVICGTVVVSLKIQLCWFTAMMQNEMLQNRI